MDMGASDPEGFDLELESCRAKRPRPIYEDRIDPKFRAARGEHRLTDTNENLNLWDPTQAVRQPVKVIKP